jgi:hypothetical protein
MKITDSTGKAYGAKVDSDYNLHVRAKTVHEAADISATARAEF